ncbi:beta-propeller domain-containing protein [Candidatus Peregrinibacteria bacterium]|nr:beta-propeller domain-containing protein [Candidatus Peregrinibacteria bacterium]
MFVKHTAAATLIALTASLLPSLAMGKSFSDVSASTQYRTAIEALEEKGVIEGYSDGTFKANNNINRAEFLKIILEARSKEAATDKEFACFPDVQHEWFAEYVCRAKMEEIISGYPDGLFRPEQNINFPEAAKILTLAYYQPIEQYSADWYEPYVRALEGSKAIPPSVKRMEAKISRGEMVEMMWRLSEDVTDQPTKAYINVKYPEVAVNLALDVPQTAKSCVDLRAFVEEANRGGRGGGPMMRNMAEDAVTAAQQGKAANETAGMGGGSDGDYSRTNVQVEGVDEADIVKTDGTYVYFVRGSQIRIVDASGTPRNVATIDMEEVGFGPSDMYVDGNRLVVIGHRWNQGGGPVQIMDSTGSPQVEKRMATDSMIWPGWGWQKAEVRIYDISDKSKPELERKVALDGSTVSSRKIGNKLYMVVNNPVRWGGPHPLTKTPTPEEVVPLMEDSAEGDKERAAAPCDDVMILPHIPQPQYLTVGVIPLHNPTGEVQTSVVLGSAENIYASLENLYVANTEYRYSWNPAAANPAGTSNEKTNVYRFEFTGDGIEMESQGSVPGRILNQFSMDEHGSTSLTTSEKYFRIATTQGNNWDGNNNRQTNNLYVLNMEMNQVGEIEEIAPGEQIYSVRFVGDRAYMVTFRNIDPLFVIDTSDPSNPKILGQLKIPGYSNYLHPYDENHLIGFGKDAVIAKDPNFAWYQGMKVAIFDVRDVENPKELHNLVIGDRGTDSPLLWNHKALLFDKSRDLLAFPISVARIPANQKVGNDGGAYGSPIFQGAHVYDITLDKGFTLRGTITHYDEDTFQKSGDVWYGYGRDIERIIRLGDSLVTVSQSALQKNALSGLDAEGSVEFQ